MTTAIEIFKIANEAGRLNSDNSIAVSTLQQVLEEKAYDWRAKGFDDFTEFLKELEGIEPFMLDGQLYAKNPTFTRPVSPEDRQKKAEEIRNVIRKMPKDAEGYVTTTELKGKLQELNISYGSGTPAAFVKNFPDIFEWTQEGTTVRVRPKGEGSSTPEQKPGPKPTTPGPKPTTPATTGPKQETTPAAPAKRFISLFELGDFACFDNYNNSLKELSQIAVEDEWFVIEEENDDRRQPYRLIDKKLKLNFAQSIRRDINEPGTGGILIYPHKAYWDTGFCTANNEAILAYFRLNQQRDAAHWQNWIFDHFGVEEGGQA